MENAAAKKNPRPPQEAYTVGPPCQGTIHPCTMTVNLAIILECTCTKTSCSPCKSTPTWPHQDAARTSRNIALAASPDRLFPSKTSWEIRAGEEAVKKHHREDRPKNARESKGGENGPANPALRLLHAQNKSRGQRAARMVSTSLVPGLFAEMHYPAWLVVSDVWARFSG